MWLLTAGLAFADSSTLTYDVTVGGKDVGDRTVTVRYLPREDGERRILSVVTVADLPVGKLQARQSGQSSPRGATFTSSVQLDAAVSEVQGIETPTGGWQLVVATGAAVSETALKASDVHFTTLDLFDPGRTRLLQDAGHVGLLVAETGAVIEGDLAAGEPTTVRIGGKSVAGTRYVLRAEGGSAEFVVDTNGFLLSSDLAIFGTVFRTVATKVPEPRSYGTIDVVEAPGEGTKEADL